MAQVEVFDDRVCRLGEGPYHDDRDGRSYWVDILGCRVLWRGGDGLAGEFATGAHVGAAVPCQSGGIVLCLPDGPVLRGTDGAISALGTYAEAAGHAVELAGPAPAELAGPAPAAAPAPGTGIRSNDAKADPAGRLWLGTMAYDESPGAAALYRLDPAERAPVRKRGKVGVSNGLGWSPDGAKMYYVDTLTQQIDVYEYDLSRGELGRRRTFAEVGGGHPDGLCVDANGGVWLALWGGAQVRRYDPDGRIERTVTLPTPQVTSCAFGGPSLDRLLITTAARGRPDDPHAGLTYIHDPGDVRGLPVARFGR